MLPQALREALTDGVKKPFDKVTVDIADGVRVRVLRSTISSVLAKPDPTAAREAAKQREEARAKAETKD